MSTEQKPLWPKPIPIIGGTGAYESGKTLFGLTIHPGPKTLYYDFEQSGASYDELGHKRINVMAEMQKLYPKGYKPVDLFLWWLNDYRSHTPGEYRVCVIDPITDIERGMTDWVGANPQHFGHTQNQYQKMSGIMWGDLKDYLKSIVADMSVRFETLYYTAHIGKEFEGNVATGKMKMKGKATLTELASLFLWFIRDADKTTGVKPNKPGAFVKKSRLLVTRMKDDEVVMEQVLPPRMPVATPKTIREAFLNPAGGREIDEIEREREEHMSDDDRLKLEVQLAEARRDEAIAKSGVTQAGKPTPPTVADALARIQSATTLADCDKVAFWAVENKMAAADIEIIKPQLQQRRVELTPKA